MKREKNPQVLFKFREEESSSGTNTKTHYGQPRNYGLKQNAK